MRSFSHTDFGDLDLSAVSVVVPARECAATIGPIVQAIDGAGQIVVLDAGSLDRTAQIAADAGAEVVQEAELMPEFGAVRGKGDAMWRSLSVVRHDVVEERPGDPVVISGRVGDCPRDLRVERVLLSQKSAGVRVEEIAGRPAPDE